MFENDWAIKTKNSSPLAQSYQLAFGYNDSLFKNETPKPVIELAATILEKSGGFFFEGHRLNAPAEWRK